jgi:hypothetical protein
MPIAELNTTGFLFTEIAAAWSLLRADYGDGYMPAALVGAPEGTRQWSIKIDVVPGQEETAPPIEGLTRARYLWTFYAARKDTNDEPFWIEVEDPDDGRRKKFLASFTEHALSFEVLCARIYATGLQLRERRIQGTVSPVLI